MVTNVCRNVSAVVVCPPLPAVPDCNSWALELEAQKLARDVMSWAGKVRQGLTGDRRAMPVIAMSRVGKPREV
jgi:hypothetical protein